MTTKEFIARIKEMGLSIEIDHIADTILVCNTQGIVSTVSMINQFEMNAGYYLLEESDKIRGDLFEVLVEYASTPIEERYYSLNYSNSVQRLNEKINMYDKVIAISLILIVTQIFFLIYL